MFCLKWINAFHCAEKTVAADFWTNTEKRIKHDFYSTSHCLRHHHPVVNVGSIFGMWKRSRTLTQVLITNTLYFKPIRPARNMPSDSNVNGTKHLKWPISFWNMTLDYRILTDNAPTPGNIVWPSAYENYDWEDGQQQPTSQLCVWCIVHVL